MSSQALQKLPALPAASRKVKHAVQHSDLDQAQRDLTVSQYLVRVSRQTTLPAENKTIASESQPADAVSEQGMVLHLHLPSWSHSTIIVAHALHISTLADFNLCMQCFSSWMISCAVQALWLHLLRSW